MLFILFVVLLVLLLPSPGATKMNDKAFVVLCSLGSHALDGDAIKGGADMNARAENGVTPLHMAAIENTNPEVIRVLLGTGADVNAKTGESVTPLHLASMGNTNPEVVAVLLESGADAKIRDAGGCSPLDMAKENKNLKGTDAYRSLEKASDFEVSERWSCPYGHSGTAYKN